MGQPTKWGRALGIAQLLPDTAKGVAAQLGVPFRSDLLTAKSPEGARYQAALGEAYFNEGLTKTGNVRDALHYYHGGPNRQQWGPKTRAYANQVLGRL